MQNLNISLTTSKLDVIIMFRSNQVLCILLSLSTTVAFQRFGNGLIHHSFPTRILHIRGGEIEVPADDNTEYMPPVGDSIDAEVVVEKEAQPVVVPDPVSTQGGIAALALSLTGSISSIIEKNPVLKYVIASIIAVVVITTLKSMFTKDDESVQLASPPPEVSSVPHETTQQSAVASFLVAGLGVVAGSLVLRADKKVDTPIPVLTPSTSSSEGNSGNDSLSNADKAKIGVGGTVLASGVGFRKIIVRKILSIWF